MAKKPIKISVRVPEDSELLGEDEDSIELDNERTVSALMDMRRQRVQKHGSTSDPAVSSHLPPEGAVQVKKPTEAGREALVRDFREASDKKAITGMKLPSGAGSWRRVIPKKYKSGEPLPDPKDAKKVGYKPGPYMTRSEAGAVGEALVYLNPQLRSIVENHYGGPMTIPEGSISNTGGSRTPCSTSTLALLVSN